MKTGWFYGACGSIVGASGVRYDTCMETATVITDGETQMVRLPRGFHLPTPTVHVRQEGEAIVLEPLKPRAWPDGFFDEIHISDPAFTRPDQGTLPPVKPF